jgi:multidrug resistance efflux pump
MKQLQEAASQAQAALATIQAEADQRIATKEAAAQAQVESYKQKWREEFDKRRKLHNLVSIHVQLTLLHHNSLHDGLHIQLSSQQMCAV